MFRGCLCYCFVELFWRFVRLLVVICGACNYGLWCCLRHFLVFVVGGLGLTLTLLGLGFGYLCWFGWRVCLVPLVVWVRDCFGVWFVWCLAVVPLWVVL